MKMTVYENDLIVSTEELRGLVFRLTMPGGDGNYINIGQDNTMGAEIYEKEIPLADGKTMLLQTRHAPDLQPIYDIMDGYKGLILVDIQYKASRVTIEW